MQCRDHPHSDCSCHKRAQPATQSLEELDFLKSACSPAQKGDTARLRDLLAKNSQLIDDDGVGGHSGYTPLHYAARAGHGGAVELLLAKGADPNRRTAAGGATSLHRAAYMGHVHIVKLLLQAGADARLQDADGQTPLDKALAQGHMEVVRLLKES